MGVRRRTFLATLATVPLAAVRPEASPVAALVKGGATLVMWRDKYQISPRVGDVIVKYAVGPLRVGARCLKC